MSKNTLAYLTCNLFAVIIIALQIIFSTTKLNWEPFIAAAFILYVLDKE